RSGGPYSVVGQHRYRAGSQPNPRHRKMPMNDRLHAGMREASRLTRAGRLIDATALLQRVLQSGRGLDPTAGNAGVPTTIDLVPETVEVTTAEGGRPEGAVRAGCAERAGRSRPGAVARSAAPFPRPGHPCRI